MKLNICIPYRNRSEHLEAFFKDLQVPSNVNFLIVEQADDGKRFNLGKLTNVGFDYFDRIQSDYSEWMYMYHPVDLLPANRDFTKYFSFIDEVKKYGFAGFWPERINAYYKLAMYDPLSYKINNGYSNECWGWGGEDDDFTLRTFFTKSGILLNKAFKFETEEDFTVSPDRKIPGTDELNSRRITETRSKFNNLIPHITLEDDPVHIKFSEFVPPGQPYKVVNAEAIPHRDQIKQEIYKDGLTNLQYDILTTSTYYSATKIVVSI